MFKALSIIKTVIKYGSMITVLLETLTFLSDKLEALKIAPKKAK